jgi:hypothetical protein
VFQNDSYNIGDANDTCHFVVGIGHVQSMNSVLAHVLNNGLEGHVRFNCDWFVGGLMQDVRICMNRVLDKGYVHQNLFWWLPKTQSKFGIIL